MLRDARAKRFKEGQRVLVAVSGHYEAVVSKVSEVLQPNPNAPMSSGSQSVTLQFPAQEIQVPIEMGGLGNVFILDDPSEPDTSVPPHPPNGGSKISLVN